MNDASKFNLLAAVEIGDLLAEVSSPGGEIYRHQVVWATGTQIVTVEEWRLDTENEALRLKWRKSDGHLVGGDHHWSSDDHLRSVSPWSEKQHGPLERPRPVGGGRGMALGKATSGYATSGGSGGTSGYATSGGTKPVGVDLKFVRLRAQLKSLADGPNRQRVLELLQEAVELNV